MLPFLHYVRFWPKADMSECTANVRFWGKSGHQSCCADAGRWRQPYVFDNRETQKLILSIYSRQTVGLAAMDPNTRTIVIALFILAAVFALAMGGHYLR
jgi:hypothetical protein